MAASNRDIANSCDWMTAAKRSGGLGRWSRIVGVVGRLFLKD